MSFSVKQFHRKVIYSSWVLLVLGTGANAAFGQDFRLESVGARGGFSFSSPNGRMNQAEAFVDFNLPWGWDLGKDWHLQSKLNLSLGWLGGNDRSGVIGSAGPALALGPEKFPLSVEAGVSGTGLSQTQYGEWNFGTLFQFTSYIGLNVDVTKHWRLGYRFQHMSNAGLSQHNPGFNMNMFALSYVF